MLTRRLLLAKQLLTETALPVTEVAFASGFASLRRFNDAFRRRYGMPPTRLRRTRRHGRRRGLAETLTLRLVATGRPTTGRACSRSCAPRQLAGVEWVTDDAYARTVRLGDAHGLDPRDAVPKDGARCSLELTHSLRPRCPRCSAACARCSISRRGPT